MPGGAAATSPTTCWPRTAWPSMATWTWRNNYAQSDYHAFYGEFYLNPHVNQRADGQQVLTHNLGLSLLIAPAYALGGLTGVLFFLAGIGALLADQRLPAWAPAHAQPARRRSGLGGHRLYAADHLVRLSRLPRERRRAGGDCGRALLAGAHHGRQIWGRRGAGRWRGPGHPAVAVQPLPAAVRAAAGLGSLRGLAVAARRAAALAAGRATGRWRLAGLHALQLQAVRQRLAHRLVCRAYSTGRGAHFCAAARGPRTDRLAAGQSARHSHHRAHLRGRVLGGAWCCYGKSRLAGLGLLGLFWRSAAAGGGVGRLLDRLGILGPLPGDRRCRCWALAWPTCGPPAGAAWSRR